MKKNVWEKAYFLFRLAQDNHTMAVKNAHKDLSIFKANHVLQI